MRNRSLGPAASPIEAGEMSVHAPSIVSAAVQGNLM
jgi:hypothetical protein